MEKYQNYDRLTGGEMSKKGNVLPKIILGQANTRAHFEWDHPHSI